MIDPSPATEVRRAWPEVLYLDDLAAVLGARSRSGARRIVVREGIPHGFVSRRLFVRREALAAWFAERECPAEAQHAPSPVAPPPWATELLRTRRRGR